MCGITGIYDTTNNQMIDQTILSKMADTLSHRGPDDSGFYITASLGLGFMRLSMIVLSFGIFLELFDMPDC